MVCQVSLQKFPVYPSDSISLVSAFYISDLGSSSLLEPFVPSHVILFGALWMPYFSFSLLGMIFPRPTWADSLLQPKNKQFKQGRGTAFLGVLLKLLDLLKVKNFSIGKDRLTTFPAFSNYLGISL